MKTTQMNKFSWCHAHLLKLRLLKVDFLYRISKNEHLNGKDICATEKATFLLYPQRLQLK